ncbi:MAG: A24 family peptidase [Oscillospiraceae bacterium]|nr:A24 family peptidase [Oscillospiraceae bacterium]
MSETLNRLMMGFIITLGVFVILAAIAVIDFKTMEIPDSLILALLPFAVMSARVFTEINIWERAAGFFVISLPMLIISLLINGAFGGGDIKLAAACGFILGWKNMLAAFSIALLLGGVYAIYLLLSRKAKKGAAIAFGPYLCAGICLAMLYGGEIGGIIESYLNLFLFIWQ